MFWSIDERFRMKISASFFSCPNVLHVKRRKSKQDQNPLKLQDFAGLIVRRTFELSFGFQMPSGHR